jgi:hypothetical protein
VTCENEVAREAVDGDDVSEPTGNSGTETARTGPVRVVLVDDHAMFRTGVRAELAQATDVVDVVAEAADTAEAISAS